MDFCHIMGNFKFDYLFCCFCSSCVLLVVLCSQSKATPIYSSIGAIAIYLIDKHHILVDQIAFTERTRRLAGSLVQESKRGQSQHEGTPNDHLDPGQGRLEIQKLRKSTGSINANECERFGEGEPPTYSIHFARRYFVA